MEEKNIYILNPEYHLKKDRNRVLLTNRIADPTIKDFMGFVHPLYAIMLSFFDGKKNLGQVLKTTAERTYQGSKSIKYAIFRYYRR